MKKNNKLPSLALLRGFEAAARHESYTMAAEELGVTQGAVSRQVHELENAIGAPLFRRVGRAVHLTDAGRSFFSEISIDLDNLRGSISRAIVAGEGATLLSIAVLPTFASRWLVPRLPDFKASYPHIELDVQSHSDPFDLEEKRIDLAIHFGRHDWPDARLTPLCPEYPVIVASPDLIKKFGIESEQDVFHAPLLHLSSRPALWTQYRGQLNMPGPDALSGSRFDQFEMLISGALAGLGAAILPTYLIEAELASHDLIKIGSMVVSPDEGYFLATPLGLKNEIVSTFSGWINRQVRPPTHLQE